MDGGIKTSTHSDAFSLTARQRAIQRASSQKKIDRIRTSHANLLGFTKPKETDLAKLALIPATQPIKTDVDGFTRLRDYEEPNNPFTPQRVDKCISLSVFNRPKSMVANRANRSKTCEELVRKIPGWKPKELPPDAIPDPADLQVPEGEEREALIPEFNMSNDFELVSKNCTDSARLHQLEEIASIRDYLARPHIKREEKDKTYVNIPHMKTFERAIMLPDEVQSDLKTKKYPTYGHFLMENPFPAKKKGKKVKGKKGKK